MKIGVFDPVFGDLELEPMLDRIHQAGMRECVLTEAPSAMWWA